MVKDNRNSIRKEVLHLIKFVKKTVAIPELKNGRKSLDTLKFRSFEALYLAAKKYFTAERK
ncbi:hypothetical protein ACP28U_002556 [Enterococcus faecium]